MKASLLYVGNLRSGGNGRDRISMLTELGHNVEGFDTYPYRAFGPKLLRRMTSRWKTGPIVWKLNRDLIRRAEAGEYDVLIVDKGTIVSRKAIVALKKHAAKRLAIHYTPDAAFHDNRSRLFIEALPYYDLAVTTKPFELENYSKAGAAQTILIHQGFGSRMDPNLTKNLPAEFENDVVFVGHCQPHYADILRAVAAKANLAIWGPGWHNYARQNSWAQSVVKGAGLYGPDYAKALAGAKIGIGLLSKRVTETTTTRTFEIPAIGTFLLAERTMDHQALFVEGEEAEFFDDVAELLAKIQAYLTDDKRRDAVAAAGQRRCFMSHYSTSEQFAKISDWISERVK